MGSGFGAYAFGSSPWGGGGPPPPDTTPPYIGPFVPAANSELAAGDLVAVSVTDASGAFASIALMAAFPTGVVEQVYDGADFVGPYAGVSSRIAISLGFTFGIGRAGGWTSAPTIRVVAVDAAGNVAGPVAAAYRLLAAPAPVSFLAEEMASADDRVELRGLGLVAPFRRDRKNDFASGSGTKLIGANIHQILITQAAQENAAGDVPWDGTLGSHLHLLQHRNGNAGLDEIARHYVVDAIRRQEPRARITKTRVVRRKNVSFLVVKFVAVDRSGRAIGDEDELEIPLPE